MMTNEQLSAVSGALAVGVSITALIWQSYQARSVHQVSLLLGLQERFNAEKLCRKRAEAAQFLLNHADADHSSFEWDAVSDILDFFQVVGTLAKAGYVDRSLMHNFFYFWLSHYYPLCEKHIQHMRRFSPITWKNVCWLYLTLRSYDLRHNQGALSSYLPEQHTAFLQWEVSNTCGQKKPVGDGT